MGGLTAVVVHNGPEAGTYFCGYDGNGNVAVLVDGADGSEAARYEYGPFGELIRSTGDLARVNPFRFSTKYQDEETDLLYYGYRYYTAGTGRWLSRDPLEEMVTRNLYAFVDNDGINFFDLDGLEKGAEALVRMTRNGPSAFGDMPIGPITGLRMLMGLPFSILSGDIFISDAVPQVRDGECNVVITVNGILNDRQRRRDLNFLVSQAPRFRDSQPMIGINRTSYLGDFLQILGDELRAIQVASIRLARQINSVYEQMRENECCCGRIQVLAHSQGTMVFRQALPMVRNEARRLIYYTGIGGETTIQFSLTTDLPIKRTTEIPETGCLGLGITTRCAFHLGLLWAFPLGRQQCRKNEAGLSIVTIRTMMV